jgi:hypothetical protein
MPDSPRHPAASLIPGLDGWNNGRGVDLEDWIQCEGSYPDAIGYSSIFWPRFVEQCGYVLLCPFDSSALAGFERQSDGDRASVEAVMNHRHMELLFQKDGSERSEARMKYLGETMAEIYRAKLAHDFPARSFTVEYDYESDTLTFFQNRRTGLLSRIWRAIG